MNNKYMFSLLGVSAAFAAISLLALGLFVSHTQFRQTAGHDKPSFDQFSAKVQSGGFPATDMARMANNWFAAQQQDHQLIQQEQNVSDRQAFVILFMGVFGLVAALFQTQVIFSLRNELRKRGA